MEDQTSELYLGFDECRKKQEALEADLKDEADQARQGGEDGGRHDPRQPALRQKGSYTIVGEDCKISTECPGALAHEKRRSLPSRRQKQ